VKRVAQRLVGYSFLLAGVVSGFWGFTALAGRNEGGSGPGWGWPETVVLLVSIALVVAGLVILTVRPGKRPGQRA
jgi:hypothetical protein